MNTEPSQSPAPPSPPALPGEPPPPEISAAEVFQPLDRRVLKLWRLRHLIASAVILGLLLVPAGFLLAQSPESWPWLLAGWGLVAALRLAHLFWYPPRAYAAWGWRLDGRVLETRHGVWFRTRELLPLSRLQHVDLHSGPIERSLGLASLLLHTAGTHHATIVVPGLDAKEAGRLRDQLVAAGGDDGV